MFLHPQAAVGPSSVAWNGSDLLRRRARQTELGITFIHVPHSQEEAMALADTIVVMDLGRIAQPEEIGATICAIADPKLFGFTTGQVFAANGGMYLD